MDLNKIREEIDAINISTGNDYNKIQSDNININDYKKNIYKRLLKLC